MMDEDPQDENPDIGHNQEYEVEKIVDERMVKQYLVRWKGYPNSDNSWLLERKMNCAELIAAYEQEKANQDKSGGSKSKREPDKIIGATDSTGELMFLMKWKGTDNANLVPAREANQMCPQIVIEFLEERLTWASGDTDKLMVKMDVSK